MNKSARKLEARGDAPVFPHSYRVVQDRMDARDRACAADYFHRALAFTRLSIAAFAAHVEQTEFIAMTEAEVAAVTTGERYPDTSIVMALRSAVSDALIARYGQRCPPVSALDEEAKAVRRRFPRYARELSDAAFVILHGALMNSDDWLEHQAALGNAFPPIMHVVDLYLTIYPDARLDIG